MVNRVWCHDPESIETSRRQSSHKARKKASTRGVQTALLLLLGVVLVGCSWVQERKGSDELSRSRRLLELQSNERPCAGVTSVSREKRCSYVTQYCKTEAILNYLEIYYCHAERAGWHARIGMQVMCVFGILLLFRVLSTTAEDYFSPILTQMSQDFYLPPRLAGVTLMAWGNGAPDIFSSMAAVKSGEYELALGGQLGAGMFIGTVVVGCVLRAGQGATMRGALIRDVTSYMLAAIALAVIIVSGKVTVAKSIFLLGGYGAFVMAVCAADVIHRVRRRRDTMPGDEELEKDLEEGLLLPDSPTDSPEELPPLVAPQPQSAILRHKSVEELSDRSIELPGLPARDAAPATSVVPTAADCPARRAASLGGDLLGALPPPHVGHQRAVRGHRHGVLPTSPPLSYSDIVHMPGSEYRERAWAELSDSHSYRRLRLHQQQQQEEAQAGAYHPPSRASVDNSFLHSPLVEAAIESARQPSDKQGPEDATAAGGPAADGLAAEAMHPPLASLRDSTSGGSSTEQRRRQLQRQPSRWLQAAHYATLRGFVEQHLLQRLLAAVTVLEWPFTLARRATIPLLEQECYSRRWLIVSLGCGPVAIAAYLRSGLGGLVLGVAVGAAAATAGYYTTQHDAEEQPPEWSCGLKVPLGAVLVALAGFAVACMWIDTVASELVGLLRFFGVLAHVSSLVLGLTILAWGNSIPDLITDVAMARTGYCNMAMTACFAGPLCNMLCGLGLGFLLLTSSSAGGVVAVHLSTPILVNSLIVIANCALVLALGLTNHGHLPARAAHVLMGLYILYLFVSLSTYFIAT